MEITKAQPDRHRRSPIEGSRQTTRKHSAIPSERKRPGSLPLRMFLSMDDDLVHPDCVYASNPFHKCADHCSRRGKSEDGKGSRKIDVNPKCVYASNPFHVCADACVQRLGAAGDDRGRGGGRRNSDKGSERVVTVKETKDGVHPMCMYASNPFHTCVDSCFQKMAQKDGVRSGAFGMAKQRNEEVAANQPMKYCKYAFNPFHNCAEYCIQKKPGRDLVKTVSKEERKEVTKKMEEKNSLNKCEDVSKVDHKHIEDCIQKIPEIVLTDRDKLEESNETGEIIYKDCVQPEFVNPTTLLDTCAKVYVQKISKDQVGKNKWNKSQLLLSSPIVFPNFIFLLVYLAHLVVTSVAYSKKSKA